jgi:hypothetical protein
MTVWGDITTQVHGQFISTRLYEPDSDTYQVRIDQADEHVLVADGFLREIIEQPSQTAWIASSEQPRHTILVFNGCNCRVDYMLTKYHPDAEVWEARILADGYADTLQRQRTTGASS